MIYFKQETNYTCGCASIRICLSALNMDVVDEKTLINVLQTTPNKGTDKENIINYFKNLNLNVIYENNSNIERVINLFNDGFIIILLVSVDVPHIVVLNNIDNHQLKIFDPYFGKITLMNRKFNSNLQKYPLLRWRIIESEFKHLPEFDFIGYNENKSFIAIKK
jgi:ABC-type bacteriocin/lantibiotic exporter with double-glycine peptidase domain